MNRNKRVITLFSFSLGAIVGLIVSKTYAYDAMFVPIIPLVYGVLFSGVAYLALGFEKKQ